MIMAWMLYATVLAALLGAAAALLENGFAALRMPRRWIWAAAIAASMIIPGAFLLLPSQSPTPIEAPIAVAPSGDLIASTTSPIAFDVFRSLDPLNGLLSVLWLAASLVLLATLAWTSWRTKRHAAAWQPSRVDGIDVRYSASSGPAVIGCFPGTIVLPRWTRQLGSEWQAMMVLHEAEHVRARDTALIAGGLILAALAPWNVVVWWQFKRLRHAVELDCDDRVLRRGVNRRAYGELLIELTQRGQRQFIPALGFAARKPLLSRRISAMMEQTKHGIGVRVISAATVAAGLIVIGCTMPTPPDAEDSPNTFETAESNNAVFGVQHLKAQMEEAREALALAERQLEEHVATESDTPVSEAARIRRVQLIRSMREARELYESLRRHTSELRDNQNNEELTWKYRGESDEALHFGPETDTRHKVKPIIYIDGERVEGDFRPNRLDDIFGFTAQQSLRTDQIERIEVMKGQAGPDDLPPVPTIHITTKTN